jgi:hypothetical protein
MYSVDGIDVGFIDPKDSVCMTWNGNKVKTFDGLTYRYLKIHYFKSSIGHNSIFFPATN